MIIFVHIPKCAGTSFSKMIEDSYSSKFQHVHEIEDWSIKNGSIYDSYINGDRLDFVPDYCHSHFCHGFHKLFPTEDYDYITFLRDPITRTRSAIRFNAARVKKRGNPGIWSDDMFCDLYNKYEKNRDSYRFIESLIENNIMCNQMTKQLSGIAEITNTSLSRELQQSANWFPPYYREKTPYSEDSMERMLELAIENLRTYSFIGFQENMKYSLNRFKNKFPKIKTTVVENKLKSTTKKQFEFEKEDYSVIEEMNKYDIKLYEAAKEMI